LPISGSTLRTGHADALAPAHFWLHNGQFRLWSECEVIECLLFRPLPGQKRT